jgi:pyrroloquinoline quinone (PQQ) biosynthesis protein C
MLASPVRDLMAELDQMANAQFDSPEFRHLFAVPMTLARARCYTIQMTHFVLNRRDCWAYVQASAPLEVKRLVCAHEQEELIHDTRAGADHPTLAAREAAVLGLTWEEIEQAELVPGVVAAFYAWRLIAKERPWLEAFTASSVMERRNSDAVVQGGGVSARMGRKMAAELGLPLERFVNATTHMAADVDHASLMEQVAARYVTNEEARQAVLRAARETYVIDRAFRAAIAEAMEDLP